MIKNISLEDLVEVTGGGYIEEEENGEDVYYVMINNEKERLPSSLAYGLFTGYIDLDFCKNGISDKEALMFYGVAAKKLKELIAAFEA